MAADQNSPAIIGRVLPSSARPSQSPMQKATSASSRPASAEAAPADGPIRGLAGAVLAMELELALVVDAEVIRVEVIRQARPFVTSSPRFVALSARAPGRCHIMRSFTLESTDA